jgi:hypothetical protein
VKLEVISAFDATPLFGIYLPTDEEIARYGTMRDDYLRKCKAEPFINRCALALSIGARTFGISIPELQAARDQMKPRLTEDRQRLMAFSRIVSFGAAKRPNSWKGIAKAFHRKHPTVINATQKYGAQIAAALEMSR